MAREKRSLDIVNGNLFRNFLIFAPPLMLSNLLQCMFRAADTVVVGHFSGENALAAVGSTTMLLSIFTWSLGGLSSGADVVASQLFGQKNEDGIRKTVSTGISIALICGIGCLLLGQLFGKAFLQLIGVPANIMGQALLYIRIFLFCMPFMALYNFGAALIRSSGDTRRPTVYLSVGGALNLVLNVLFVAGFGWDVAGVAIASVIAQMLSTGLVLFHLLRIEGVLHLDLRSLRIDGVIAKKILTIGIPSAVQSMMFSISNIVVQAAVNSFGELAIAGNTAAISLEEFMYVTLSAVSQTCVTFTGYNVGAGKPSNVKKVLAMTMGLAIGLSLVTGGIEVLLGPQLLSIYSDNPSVIAAGMCRMRGVVLFMFLNAIMDVFTCSMRGMGTSAVPSAITVVGICGIRVLFVKTVFAKARDLQLLYYCFPLSWVVTSSVQAVFWILVFRRLFAKKNSNGDRQTSC
ncbi:MAG: MATE family efflux transporter [Firmicutes bacterium]|nr:MATE family efflux transporter [Bacillota bacterium]